MTTVGALVFDEQFRDLKEIASARPWQLDDSFVFGLTARDGERYWLKVDCTDYPAIPPAWHWYNPESEATDGGRHKAQQIKQHEDQQQGEEEVGDRLEQRDRAR